MDKKLAKAQQSNYTITISFSDEEKNGVRSHVLQHFAKDMNVPGFRAGKVPLHIVEQKVSPEYISMAINEHLINKGLQALLAENADVKFI